MRVEHGDCLEVLPRLLAEGVLVDSVVTDPPYHLTSIVKRFSADNAAPVKVGKTGAYARSARGFMGKKWDGGDIAFRPETWRAVFDVMKPGAHLVAFGGTRTYHRMVCAIEDAGFEVRDQLAWLYGCGFPKSHNQHGDWEGWGSALKPAIEPIVLARKPLCGTIAANLQAHGVGALNIEACRIETEGDLARWPANVIHDGSDEVLAGFPDTQSGLFLPHHRARGVGRIGTFEIRDRSGEEHPTYGDSGSAARFFYSAKATADERFGSKHPTVKPLDLMRWLCRLITPPGGLVLDPFAGSGTTGIAAMAEGFNAILIEREAEYIADINRRIAHVTGAGGLAAIEMARLDSDEARAVAAGLDTPLFGEAA
ncbi:MAG: hypothetical protein ABS87_00925 [Sphingomonas sp. SCN 67-18]|nr:site-specific DNA-methyltransferase [Sphingomonas sp. SCN 67-18]ODU22761.1 MAG: hypothetical protein ABS87_00925 [Sphingomonas sp. SCN 67-18]